MTVDHDSLAGKAAGKERLFPPSAFTGFVLESHTFFFFLHLNSGISGVFL